MTFTPLPFNQIPTVTSVPAGSQIICVVGGNLRRADFSLLPKGDPGDEGPQGPAGSSINLLGTLDNEGQLPTSPTPINGDAYFIGTNLWVYTVDEWVDTGTFQGENGQPTEFQVASGFLQYRVVGDAEWINLVSISDFQGNSISAASGVPNNANGNNNDLYINVTNGDLYQKLIGTWSVIGNLKGPQGDSTGGGIGLGDSLTILGGNGSNYLQLNMTELMNGIVEGERRYLGKYIVNTSFSNNSIVELSIDFGRWRNQIGAVGEVWMEIDLQLNPYNPDTGFGNRIARISMFDLYGENESGGSLYSSLINLPSEGDGTTNYVSFKDTFELRIDNTALIQANLASLRSQINAIHYAKIILYKQEGSNNFDLHQGVSDLGPLMYLSPLGEDNTGSYYGYGYGYGY